MIPGWLYCLLAMQRDWLLRLHLILATGVNELQQTDRSAVSGALSLPVAVNLNQVLGARLGEPSPGCCTCYAAFVFTLNCRNRRHSATRSLSSSTRLGSLHHYTERNAANEQQTLLPGHAGADEHCGNDCEQCCHLASQHGYSPFQSGLPEQQGDRWNGSLSLSVARVVRNSGQDSQWKPDQHFPVSELQVASTLTCIKPCCRL